MAGDVTIEVRHAVYDTFDHQRGADLSVDAGKLNDLLVTADSTLDQSSGAFFRTIDGRFVLGFEGGRTEGTKGQMRHFDLFAMPVNSVERVGLPELVQRLEDLRVDEYTQSPEAVRTLRFRPRRARSDGAPENRHRNENRNRRADNDDRTVDSSPRNERSDRSPDAGEGLPGSDSVDDRDRSAEGFGRAQSDAHRRVDAWFVAEMWEQIRRDSVRCRASIEDIDRFAAAVEGSLRAISFVSAERRETGYFDVIGDGQLETRFKPRRLAQIVANLDRHDRLRYDALPTYREELRAKRRLDRAEVRDQTDLRRMIEETTDSFATQLVSETERIPERAAELMTRANRGELAANEEDGGNGFTSRLTGFVGGHADEELAFLDPERFPSLDAETVAAIDTELEREHQRIRDRLTEELLAQLERGLLAELEEQSEQIAEEAASRLDETNRSELHERARDPDAD
jgi:hypothetical protein